MTPPPSIEELVAQVLHDAGPTPLERLTTASAANAELARSGDAMVGHFVEECRRAGHTWAEISGALGVSRQAAHKRFASGLVPTLSRFTDRARQSFDAITRIAAEVGDVEADSGHVLLALFEPTGTIAERILTEHGLSRAAVEEQILASRGRRPSLEESTLGEEATEVLTMALGEALKLGHNYIGTEHLLLALHQVPGAPAAAILDAAGLSASSVRATVIATLTRR